MYPIKSSSVAECVLIANALLLGNLLQDLGTSFSHIAVVLPDKDFHIGAAVFKKLDSFDAAAINMRHNAVKRMAAYMQWSWKDEPNVLSTTLAVYRHLNYSTVEPNCFLHKNDKKCPGEQQVIPAIKN